MAKSEDFPLQKHTLHLFLGEFEMLREMYAPHISAAKVVRELVHKHLLDKGVELEQVPLDILTMEVKL